MTSRERVKAAIAHRQTNRVPYVIDPTRETRERLQRSFGIEDVTKLLDNDVLDISVPWWHWYNLDPEWRSMEIPQSRITVLGRGSYDNLEDSIKAARQKSDKYFLVRIYGSHFEKAVFARGMENFLADIAGGYSCAGR